MTTAPFDADTGLVCAYLVPTKGPAKPLTWDEIGQVKPDDGLLWVHLDFSKQRASDWIENESGLDYTITEALLAEDSRPRSVQFVEGILTILRGVNNNPGSEAEDMVSIRMWLEKHRIITTRRRRLLSVSDVRQTIEAGSGPRSSGQFVAEIAARLVDRIVEVVNDIDDAQDAAEGRIEGSGETTQRGEFADIRRRTARIRRHLLPQRDALDRLSRMQGPYIDAQDGLDLQEAANNVLHAVEELDLTRERAMVAREEVLNILAHEQNSKMYLLSIVAAVFLPLTFISGLLGMNVGGIPWADSPVGFWGIVGICVVIVVMMLFYFRHKRWF
ncbi:MAG: zinc transporter ZntB [Xanthomonadales bacterium]|nr:zinc transporter ZntB [Xanthomonadales bacterium]